MELGGAVSVWAFVNLVSESEIRRRHALWDLNTTPALLDYTSTRRNIRAGHILLSFTLRK